jgi:RHS repeat-associated protein
MNSVHHLTKVTATAPSDGASYITAYGSFDVLGRTTQSAQTTTGQTYSFQYAYNQAGGLELETYPSGRQVTTCYDTAGRPNLVTGTQGGPVTTYVGSVTYAPQGAISALALGNKLTEQTTYSVNRQQPVQISVGPQLTMNFSYCPGQSSSCATNNGNMQSQIIARASGTWTQAYGYDNLNRLTGASETGAGTAWSESYGYDPFGNRWVASTSEQTLSPETPQTQNWYNGANNRISTFSYDGAGNILSIPSMVRTFVYDGENRQTSASVNDATTTYAYDGDGRRVQKAAPSGTTVYVYDANGSLTAEYGTPTDSGTTYLTLDHLGSTRLTTDASGNPKTCYDYLPFGSDIAAGIDGRPSCYPASSGYPQAPDILSEKFTSKERDSETGLDFFDARYMSSVQGRFTSADPSGISINPTNPQTWNKYLYALNNPLTYVDKNGLWPTSVHDDILNSIFSGVLSARQVKLLSSVSWGQDNPFGARQDPANSNWHFQCTPAQSPDGCAAGIASYVGGNIDHARALGDNFGLVDEALTYFGVAAHALADAGSPYHVSDDGSPTTWNGVFGAGGLHHVIGEQLDTDDWYHIGQSIRNVISGFFGAFPEQASRLLGNPDTAAQTAITNFVNSRAHQFVGKSKSSLSPDPVVQDATRQCALGNRAACGAQ